MTTELKLNKYETMVIKECLKDNRCYFGLIKNYREYLDGFDKLGRKDEILNKIEILNEEIIKNQNSIKTIVRCFESYLRLREFRQAGVN